MLEDDPRIAAQVGAIEKVGVDILKHVDDGHILKRMALEVSRVLWLPQSTVFMIGMGIVSCVAMRKYGVSYRDGGILPLGLYLTCEQSSGAAKSRCVNIFKDPFSKVASEINKRIRKEIVGKEYEIKSATNQEAKNELLGQVQELKNNLKSCLFISNTTPEGLEKTLPYSDGFFSCVSDEQGLLNTLLGKAYGDGKKNNNDLVLQGFTGNYYSSARATRDPYNGRVIGSVVVYAQHGSFKTIFDESNGTGLCERFLVLSEPGFEGKRDFLVDNEMDKALYVEYCNMCRGVADILAVRGGVTENIDRINMLSLSSNGYLMIAKVKQELEPHLATGGKYSSPTAMSMASKIDIQIMKIASLLYIFSDEDKYYDNLIPDAYVQQSINLCRALFEYAVEMMGALCMTGIGAEKDVILDIFEKTNNRQRSLQDIKNTARKRPEFKHLNGSCMPRIEEVVLEMARRGELFMKVMDGTAYFRK
jgi:hypothetical protein